MFKQIKAKSREAYARNYKTLITVSLPLMFSSFAADIIINFLASKLLWSDLTDFFRLIILLAFLFFEFVSIPVSRVLIFKAIIIIKNNDDKKVERELKKFFNFSNVGKIVLINFIPCLFAAFLKLNSSKLTAFNLFKVKGTHLIILSLIAMVVTYMFFACNYYFALKEYSVTETVKASFKIMHKNIFKGIALAFSFLPWAFLIALIYLAIKAVFTGSLTYALNAYTPILDSFISFGFGVDLYLIPYMYLTAADFIQHLVDNEPNQRIPDKYDAL